MILTGDICGEIWIFVIYYLGFLMGVLFVSQEDIMKKLVLPVIAAILIFMVNAKGVYAAGFDPLYYAQRYPEIANSVGCDEKALYEHYVTIGQKEGRYQNAEEECAATARAIDLQNAKATGNTEAVERIMKEQKKNEAAAATNTTNATAAVSVPIAGSYVDVDIANQTMTLFQNNFPVLSSPCVTGTPKNGRSTPTGVFYVMEKTPGKRLKGPSWDVWVDRWMRFTQDSCGLHDASWRRKFGGNIYLSNGSHGCVNLPKDIAYTLYDLIAVGTPVIVH